MTEKYKQVWEELEQAIGGCCLHKKAAFLEATGQPLQQLSLVTSAPVSAIEAFLGKRKVDRSQLNRFVFVHNGVNVDLTTFCDVEDLDELHEKSFRHTLTIDSIGISRDGRISDAYGGLSDAYNQIIRMSNENAVISEVLFRRILQLVARDGYSVNEAVKNRIEEDKLIEKESYRKKFCEVLCVAVNETYTDWVKVAWTLDVLGNALGHRAAIVSYTQNLQGQQEPGLKRTFLLLIFALIKVSGRELQQIMKGDAQIGYFDSLCANLQQPITTHGAYREKKEKYGEDFLKDLFDMQELWMAMEEIPYKRPSERDFDRMALLIADDRFWSAPVSMPAPTAVVEEPPVQEAEDGEYRLEGEFDFRKATGEYSDEDYDEPTEGRVVDDYIPEGATEIPEEQPPIDDMAVFDDENPDEISPLSGIDTSGLDAYEAEMRGTQPPEKLASRFGRTDGIFNHKRGHVSKVLSGEL